MAVRVAFLIDRLRRAGTEAQLLALLHGLDRSRVEPHLILLDGTDAESQSLEPAGCPVIRLGVQSLKSARTAVHAWRLAMYLRNERIDVLQAYFLDSVYFGVPVAKLAGVRAVLRVRNNLGYWLTPWHRRLGRWYGRWVDRTLTNSDEGRDALMRAERLPSDRIAVLANGVDVERFADIAPPLRRGGPVRIGAVANLRPVKRLDLLIRAAVEVRKRFDNIQVAIAGDGPQRGELGKLASDLGVSECVQFHGAVSNVPEFLASLDVAVLCSDSEGMSNAILEYMAAGRAIVATRVGANDTLIRDGVDGFLVMPGSELPLAEAMLRVVSDPMLARSVGQSARQRAVESFSRVAACRRFEDFYESLLEAKQRRAA